MRPILLLNLALSVAAAVAVSGCATESHRSLAPPAVASHGTAYSGPRYKLVIGKFQNRSTYMQGIFSDGTDRLGSQAKTALMGHLQQTGRFTLVDRANMDEIAFEADVSGRRQQLTGAEVAVTGDVTEFGRRNTGDVQAFGLLGAGAKQTAYAKVVLNIVDVRTSQVLYSAFGAGEYALSNREIAGFGSTAGYDATLNGKVLDLAIREAVNRLVEGLENGSWSPT
ncbi:MAG TPA: CsgG/HfaB family protein [Candidatus Limnocylindrales bacterium]|nr:CsgG/HfaB family protein [Candidatus Limnocylindrales bacterium]